MLVCKITTNRELIPFQVEYSQLNKLARKEISKDLDVRTIPKNIEHNLPSFIMFCDDLGYNKNLPINIIGTILYNSTNPILGDIIICGRSGADAIDVPFELFDAVKFFLSKADKLDDLEMYIQKQFKSGDKTDLF